MYPLRCLLYRCAWLRLGRRRGDSPPRRVPGRGGRPVLATLCPPRPRPLQPDRKARGRLHLLGPAGWLHGLPRAAGPVPDLAVLAREHRDPRGLVPRAGGLSRVGPRPMVQHGGGPRGGRAGAHPMTPPPDETGRLDPARVREPLRALYAALDAEVARLVPVCLLSGRCCRFVEYEHILFLSAPEAMLLLADAPPPARPLDRGETCPWQDVRGR